MQKVEEGIRLLAACRTGQRSTLERGRGSLPKPEREVPAEAGCACFSPAVMWECEYFCISTGDLCSKCSCAQT